MSVTPIKNPFEGERVVGLSPTPAARVTDWNRRLNFFTGRTLSAAALIAEQEGKAGRLALRGQLTSPGVVLGLEIGLETQGDTHFLHVGSGYGLCANGEDVFVGTPARVPLRSLPVYATAALLDGAAPPEPGALAARRLGGTIAELIGTGVAVPAAGIVVLQPAQVDQLGNFDPTDPCEDDPSSVAFADEQLLDGARLIYYAWPDEWLPLPASGNQWRNHLAYAIFDREAGNAQDEVMPWEILGLPIGLIASDNEFNPLFVDRHSVVRHGGMARRRTAPTPDSGHEFLWQARIEQFAEHVTSLANIVANPAALAAEFQYVPPAGLLPPSAITFVTGNPETDTRVSGTSFFAGTFNVNAMPAPIEQLDILARECGPLAEFDTSVPSQVTIVVPVPQIWYEPDLLEVAHIDPRFQQAIDRFVHVRSIWLKRRLDVRQYSSTLALAATAEAASFPDPDPDAVESDEAVSETEIDAGIEEFKEAETPYGLVTQDGQLVVSEVKKLTDTLNAMPGVSTEVSQLATMGLEKFAELMQAKADAANDKIDFGFLRVQTDIYRTRQKMLSSEAATRLAVSPALASIAQGVSALASNDDIDSFLKTLKPGIAPTITVQPAAQTISSGQKATLSVTATGTSPLHYQWYQGNTGITSTPVGTDSGSFTTPSLTSTTSYWVRVTNNSGFADSATGTISIGTRTGFLPLFLAPGVFSVATSGFQITPAPTATEVKRTATFTGATQLFAAKSGIAIEAVARVGDVTQQQPITGASYDLRTTSVVERLQDPSSAEIKNFTVASKYSAISNFKTGSTTKSGINVDDISIPGFLDNNGAEVRKTFNDISNTTLGEILGGAHDPLPTQTDQAAIFAAGVRAMENTIDVLRQMEARVRLYHQAVDLCRAALTSVRGDIARHASRLRSIGNELAQSRHDVSVARALMAEENDRLNGPSGVNTRRDQIVTNQVKFLAYFRPRTIEARSDLPVRTIDPGLTTQTIPACLARNIAAPDELRAYVNLLRDAPLNWFRHVPPLLSKLDRLDVLHTVIQNSKLRAGFKLAQPSQPEVQLGSGPIGTHLFSVFSARQQVITKTRMATAQTDLTMFAGTTWTASRDRAVSLLSIGDLADLGHYHPEVPRVSSTEIENILKVAACLYSDFSAVKPIYRLDWAERLIELGSDINLVSLASLPNWREIPVLERKEMQSMVDWLFNRIDNAVTEAVSHINDLVRVCILLASHAPVADIIAGDVIKPTPVSPGVQIHLSADLSRVRLGMHVLMYQANQAVARGVVEDLSAGVATARVLTAASSGITLSAGSKVHFAAPDAFDRNPLTSRLV